MTENKVNLYINLNTNKLKFKEELK